MRACADCGADIGDRHGRARFCLPCAKRRKARRKRSNWPTHSGRYKGVSRALRRRLIAAAGRCALCSATESLEIDHITPRHKGGGDDAANLRVLCRRCHRAKTQAESNAAPRRPAALTKAERKAARAARKAERRRVTMADIPDWHTL